MGLGVDPWGALVVASFSSLMVNLFVFLPFELGAKEGALYLMFGWLGITPALGLAAALLSRIRELMTIAAGGGLIWTVEGAERRRPLGGSGTPDRERVLPAASSGLAGPAHSGRQRADFASRMGFRRDIGVELKGAEGGTGVRVVTGTMHYAHTLPPPRAREDREPLLEPLGRASEGEGQALMGAPGFAEALGAGGWGRLPPSVPAL